MSYVTRASAASAAILAFLAVAAPEIAMPRITAPRAPQARGRAAQGERAERSEALKPWVAGVMDASPERGDAECAALSGLMSGVSQPRPLDASHPSAWAKLPRVCGACGAAC